MKPETTAILDDEWLLRRIHWDAFKNGTIADFAFKPRVAGRDPDVNGISLYRAICLADQLEILSPVPIERRAQSGIVQLPIIAIRNLGLTVVCDSDPRVPGHVLLAELNANAYQANKVKWGAIMSQLATIASNPANILLRPTPKVP